MPFVQFLRVALVAIIFTASFLFPKSATALDLQLLRMPHLSGTFSVHPTGLSTGSVEFEIDDFKKFIDKEIGRKDFDQRCRNDTFWDGLKEIESAEGERISIEFRLSVNLWSCDKFFGNNRISPVLKPTISAFVTPELRNGRVYVRADVRNIRDLPPSLEHITEHWFNVDFTPTIEAIELPFEQINIEDIEFTRVSRNVLRGQFKYSLF